MPSALAAMASAPAASLAAPRSLPLTYHQATVAGMKSMPRLYLTDVASPAATAPAVSQRRPRPWAAPTSSSSASSEKAVAGTSVTATCE